jgi:hypothetical protein
VVQGFPAASAASVAAPDDPGNVFASCAHPAAIMDAANSTDNTTPTRGRRDADPFPSPEPMLAGVAAVP